MEIPSEKGNIKVNEQHTFVEIIEIHSKRGNIKINEQHTEGLVQLL